jgi:hypothetical protein
MPPPTIMICMVSGLLEAFQKIERNIENRGLWRSLHGLKRRGLKFGIGKKLKECCCLMPRLLFQPPTSTPKSIGITSHLRSVSTRTQCGLVCVVWVPLEVNWPFWSDGEGRSVEKQRMDCALAEGRRRRLGYSRSVLSMISIRQLSNCARSWTLLLCAEVKSAKVRC